MITPGAQYVKPCGGMSMLKLLADSWDSQLEVSVEHTVSVQVGWHSFLPCSCSYHIAITAR